MSAPADLQVNDAVSEERTSGRSDALSVRTEPVPAADWGKFEPHRLKTIDSQEIGAWLVVGSGDAPSVLLIHGIGASRSACLSRAKMLAAQGCSVLMISLRAHGDSTGDFNDMGYSARHDIVAAVEFLERRRPGKPIIVHGLSMGEAVLCSLQGSLPIESRATSWRAPIGT